MPCLLQKPLETNSNVDRKRTGTSKDKHLIIESKRHRMKTAPGLTTELNFSRQQPVSLLTAKSRLISVKFLGYITIKKSVPRKVNTQNKVLWVKKKHKQ